MGGVRIMAHYKDTANSDALYWLDQDQSVNLIPLTCVAISDDEADTIRAAGLAAANEARTWVEKRLDAYGSIGSQLDLIYHEGIDAWKLTITAVKEEFPK